jgi:hypothetical protein
MAAIAPAPTGTACCMACARKRTSGSASASVSAPAATSALYSPSECPATACRLGAAFGQPGAVAGDAAVSITGCVLVVRSSASLGPSDQRSDVFAQRGRGLVQRGWRTAGWSPQASSMPTDCEPWPGKTKAKAGIESILVLGGGRIR